MITKILISILSWVMPGAFAAEPSAFNLPIGVTPVSRDVYDLHMTIFLICCAIAVVVFGVMFYALIKHRKSLGHKAHQFHESTKIELLWTIIPVLILVAMAIPATRVLIDISDTGDSELTIKVTGYQWKWHYEYVGKDLSFFSNLATPIDAITNQIKKGENYLREVDNPLVLPTHTKVRFLFTSNDVIHSWWVPELGFKKDTIPGFINQNWATIEKPGTYRGQCAELCGANHGFMPIVVEAKSKSDFEAWLAKKKSQLAAEKSSGMAELSFESLMQRGEKTYLTYCAACHQVNGEGLGTFKALKDSKIAKGPIEQHLKIILQGKSGTAMQGFSEQLSEADIAAVTTYERNAWGNDTGDHVQASEVKALKDSLATQR